MRVSIFRSPFHYNKDWNYSYLPAECMSRQLQESFPLQQGLKQLRLKRIAMVIRLQESFPLQQGLKPADLNMITVWLSLQESFPLQQGLKHSCNNIVYLPEDLQESFPLQQGLKPENQKERAELVKLQESFPLQQGLKLNFYMERLLVLLFRSPFHYNKDWNKSCFSSIQRQRVLQESFPLQQGLKPSSPMMWAGPGAASGVLSTTTRIETTRAYRDTGRMENFRSPFHYNKDWNLLRKNSALTMSLSSGVLSTTTRIETPLQRGTYTPEKALQESFPLQQGLKQSYWAQWEESRNASGVLSTTTRIETFLSCYCSLQ